MKKAYLGLCIFAMIVLFAAPAAWAGKTFYANVIADAQCSPGTNGWSDLSVDAGLIQKDTPSSGPHVSTATFSLEQHFPNRNDWVQIVMHSPVGVDTQFDLLAAGERYDVATETFSNICTLVDGDANAVRAVVQITVENANDKRSGGKVFTGRCISFPNPCR